MNEKRHLGPEITEWRRFRALELHERGWLEVDIAEALDVNKGTVSRWLAAADAGGPEALVGGPTARRCRQNAGDADRKPGGRGPDSPRSAEASRGSPGRDNPRPYRSER